MIRRVPVNSRDFKSIQEIRHHSQDNPGHDEKSQVVEAVDSVLDIVQEHEHCDN